MRYFREKPPIEIPLYGERYYCDHPMFSECTLYLKDDRGLGVIQQRFDPVTKRFWWGPVDAWIANDIYLSPKFPSYFEKHATPQNERGLYFTVKVRSLMWALRMKPIAKYLWELFLEEREFY